MAELTETQRSFLNENPFVGIATTLRKDGSPHSTVVWVDASDGQLSFNTAVGRAKERHVKADPRASVLVIDPENAFRWVAVSGPAELTKGGADEQIDRLAKKYLGEDKYPWRNADEDRIRVVIRPEHVDASGLDS